MVRIFHKYLSLAISIQLLLWTISGIFFAFNKIELIRGEQYILEQKNTKLDLNEVTVSLAAKNLNLIQRLDEWVLKVEENSEVYYLDFSGNKLKSLNSEEAKQVVREKTNLFPVEALRIEKPSTGSEFRGRNLPLFKVSTKSDENVNVYVDAMSGEITAIRSDSWRTWDFLWGTHIMDYSERENIDNLLLKIFSLLALVSAMSGIILFFSGLKNRKIY
jgi:hypothetical protein|tara:strand:- start:1594 stop:2247 length:654 start_codon:yes stop_codon:yes gene_type:complete